MRDAMTFKKPPWQRDKPWNFTLKELRGVAFYAWLVRTGKMGGPNDGEERYDYGDRDDSGD